MPRRTVDPVTVPFTAMVNPGTTIAAPATFTPDLVPGVLEAIELQIPPGHVGTTGIRFTYSQQQIVPWSNAITWINGDDLDKSFPVDIEIDDGLKVVAYNIGNYPHSFFLRFRIRQLPVSNGIPQARLLPASQLSTAT